MIRRRVRVIGLAYRRGVHVSGHRVFGVRGRLQVQTCGRPRQVLAPQQPSRPCAALVADGAFYHATHAHSRSVQTTAQHQTQVHAAETHAAQLGANEQTPQHEAQNYATIRLRLIIRLHDTIRGCSKQLKSFCIAAARLGPVAFGERDLRGTRTT